MTSFQQVLSVDIRKLTKLRLICKPCLGKSEVARGSLFLLLALLPCLRTDTLVDEKERKRGEKNNIMWQWRQLFQNLSPVKTSCVCHGALFNLVKFLYTQVSLPISERFFPSGIG